MSNSKTFIRPMMGKLVLPNGSTVVSAYILREANQVSSDSKEEFVLAPNETLSGHLRKRGQPGRVFIDDFKNTRVAA